MTFLGLYLQAKPSLMGMMAHGDKGIHSMRKIKTGEVRLELPTLDAILPMPTAFICPFMSCMRNR